MPMHNRAATPETFTVGSVADVSKGKGWFFGHFMDDTLLKSSAVEVAYQDISGKQAAPSDAHYHRQSVEINLVVSGEVSLTVGRRRFAVSEGQFYVIYPETVVSDVSARPDTRVVVIRAPSLPDDKVPV